MWLFIWYIFTIFIAFIMAWSVHVLLKQRSAWKAFSEKKKLTYEKGRTLLASPAVHGKLGEFDFNLFSEQQPSPDGRLPRFYTVIEIGTPFPAPAYTVMGTSGKAALMEELPLQKVPGPAREGWDESWILYTSDAAITEKVLTSGRVDCLKKIFGMNISAGMFAFDGSRAVLRLETVDPMQDSEKLERIVSGLIQQAEILRVSGEEHTMFTAMAKAASVAGPAQETSENAAPSVTEEDTRSTDENIDTEK